MLFVAPTAVAAPCEFNDKCFDAQTACTVKATLRGRERDRVVSVGRGGGAVRYREVDSLLAIKYSENDTWQTISISRMIQKTFLNFAFRQREREILLGHKAERDRESSCWRQLVETFCF